MPRPPRRWFPRATYHLIVRGNNREPIFVGKLDYVKYLRMLGDRLHRFDMQCLAYALMPNHVHLMLRTGERHSVSKLMQSLHTAYTKYFNRKYERVGHVLQGRYKSVLVLEDSYALELSRYIHLNPVRAGLSQRPDQYRWSSYGAYLGREQDVVTETEVVLSLCDPVAARCRTSYTEFVNDGLLRFGSSGVRH